MKQKFKVFDQNYLGIFVTDEKGLLLTGELADGKEYKGSDIAGRDYFQEAKKTDATVVGEIVQSKATGKMIYVVCAPVQSEGGDFLGVFGMSVKAELIIDIVSGSKMGETGYAFMVDKNGIINSHPNEKFILELDLKTLNGMEDITAEMLSAKKGVQDYSFKGVDKIAGYAPVPIKNWSIALTQDREEFLQAPNAIRNSLILVVITAQLVIGFLIYFSSKSITRPINAAVAGLKDIAEGEGDLTMRLDVRSKDEVGEMAKWFNLFIAKLQVIIKQISDNSLQVSQGIQEVNENVSQSSVVSASISQDIAEVFEASRNISESSNEVKFNAQDLFNRAEELNAIVAKFKV